MLQNKLYIILLLFCFNNKSLDKSENKGFWYYVRNTPMKSLNEKTKKYNYDIAIMGLKISDYPISFFKQIFKIKKLINFEIPKITIFGYKPKAWMFLPVLTKIIYDKCELINKEENKEKENLGFRKFINPFNFYNALFYKIIEWRQNINKKNKLINDDFLNLLIKTNNVVNNSYASWTWNWILLSKKIYNLNEDEKYIKQIENKKQ